MPTRNVAGMATMEILVRGEATNDYPPEIARLYLSVFFEDTDRDAVYRRAVAEHEPIVAALSALADAGAVEQWYSDSVRVFGQRPLDAKGRRAATIYTTRIGVRAEFVDFEKLSQFIDAWAGGDGIEIGGISWDVTETNRRAYERELRREAVDDAVLKAQAYADAVGRGAVEVVRLSDPGMQDTPIAALAAPAGMMSRSKGYDSGPSMELRPEDITIGVAVEAKMIAD